MKWIAILIGALSVLAAAPAWAQSGEAYDAITKANELARAGAISRSIPFYEKGIKLDPKGYTLAYFNLAEVWRAKGRDNKAAFFYTLYTLHGSDETTLKQAKQALSELKSEKWGTLAVTGTPTEEVTITVDGYLLAEGEDVDEIALPAGTYEVEVSAIDHIATKEKVEISEGEAEAFTYGLEKMTFFGTIQVKASKEGATIKIYAGPSDKTRVVHETKAPMNEPIKIEEGRHFVEVTAPDHKRWIRNVTVARDGEVVVDATLSKSLPPEIRRDP